MRSITTLSECASEPIHTPGKIQPHGVLFALDESLNITHVSENAVQKLNGRELDGLFGTPILDILSTSAIADLQAHLQDPDIADYNPLPVCLGRTCFDMIGHHWEGRLIVEMEEVQGRSDRVSLSPYHVVRHAIARMRQSSGLESLCDAVATEVMRVTRFARVMIYRFHDNWDGEVIVEKRNGEVQSFAGLRFPASDIPSQARELYTRLTQRIIPDVNYKPVSIHHAEKNVAPLDLSMSVLRSISPFHLQYMRNMGVHASMSISIVRDGRLWGLISCADESGSRFVPFDIRASCDFLSENMSLLIESKEAKDRSHSRHRGNTQMARLLRQMVAGDHFVDGLLRSKLNMAELVSATGAAVLHGSKVVCVGDTPSDQEIIALAEWLVASQKGPIWATTQLATEFPLAESYKRRACGLLCGIISASRGEVALWFRPEVEQVLHWGGNPNKEKELVGGQLSPRTSFERWTETVKGHSLPWTADEKELAGDLLRSIIDVVLQSSEELSVLNSELERSNQELDAFAYAASHDLKEPLRGINNYTAFAQRGLPEGTEFAGLRDNLSVVIRLTHRMESLIDALLRFSHLGRTEIEMEPVDLKEVIGNTLEVLQLRIENANANVQTETSLPTVLGNKTLIQEIFTNLITNALKYNKSQCPKVKLRASTHGDMVRVSVQDNGIGILERHHQDVFKIFRRLHDRKAYGGGTGTGLTIALRIVERHGGKLWLASSGGAGSTFYFTLKAADAGHADNFSRGRQ